MLAAALVAAGRAGGAVPTVPVATVTTTIVGLTDTAGGGYDPPDPQVAAGPGFVVEMANLAERVWRTDTGAPQLVQTIPLSVFYGTGADGLTDPRILWDTSSGRWLASISNEDQSSVMLAVSHGSDPTGDWSVYSFPAGGCADQPRLGVADGVIVLAADVFQKCEGFSPVLGNKVWVVNKQQAVAGATTVSSTSFGPDTTHASLQPVQSLSPTATEYVVGVDNPSSRVVHVFAVDGVPPAAVTMQPVAQPAILPLSLPPDGQQPHPNATVRTNDDRILDAVWEGGKLWFSANTGCIPDGDTALRACARVTEVSTDTLTVDWDVNLGQAKAYLYYPAIRPDASGTSSSCTASRRRTRTRRSSSRVARRTGRSQRPPSLRAAGSRISATATATTSAPPAIPSTLRSSRSSGRPPPLPRRPKAGPARSRPCR